jgi:KipI family sensor histidine kinase inhibitor
VLIECEGNHEARRHASTLRADPKLQAQDIVPGAKTVLVIFPGPASASAHMTAVRSRIVEAQEAEEDRPTALVTIPVRYDGPDLGVVAMMTGLSPDEIVERHLARTYTVDFLGFIPGFAYLSGLDPALEVSRRSDPRTRVPAGSVAIAGQMAAIYPRGGPGGWRLLGTTNVQLFDATKDPPALLNTGTRVQFMAR